jgi:predicted ATP-dependent endonuclease of OLD family
MIRQLEVKGLRALRYVSVDLEPFLVMVGPNACGKSTLFDALLLVRDVLTSGIDAAVFGNTRMSIAPRAVDPNDLTWLRQGGGLEIAITLELPKELVKKTQGERYRFVRYELGIHTEGRLGFDHETLWLCDDIAPASHAQSLQKTLLPPPTQAIR